MSVTNISLLPELELAIQREVAKAIETAVEEAAEKTRTAIRERMGPIAMSLFNHYSVERRGQELTIKVRIAEDAK